MTLVIAALHVVGEHVNNLKASLEHEREERRCVEQQLQEEKMARVRDRLDVESECKDPFVVPALLDVFLKLSQMTDGIIEG